MPPPKDPAPHREDAALYIAYGETHLKAGDLVQAGNSFEVALRFEARSVVALTGLGQVQLLRGRFEEARRTLMQAIAIDPEVSRPRLLLAEVHAKSGRFDQATTEFKRAAECAKWERPSGGSRS